MIDRRWDRKLVGADTIPLDVPGVGQIEGVTPFKGLRHRHEEARDDSSSDDEAGQSDSESSGAESGRDLLLDTSGKSSNASMLFSQAVRKFGRGVKASRAQRASSAALHEAGRKDAKRGKGARTQGKALSSVASKYMHPKPQGKVPKMTAAEKREENRQAAAAIAARMLKRNGTAAVAASSPVTENVSGEMHRMASSLSVMRIRELGNISAIENRLRQRDVESREKQARHRSSRVDARPTHVQLLSQSASERGTIGRHNALGVSANIRALARRKEQREVRRKQRQQEQANQRGLGMRMPGPRRLGTAGSALSLARRNSVMSASLLAPGQGLARGSASGMSMASMASRRGGPAQGNLLQQAVAGSSKTRSSGAGSKDRGTDNVIEKERTKLDPLGRSVSATNLLLDERPLATQLLTYNDPLVRDHVWEQKRRESGQDLEQVRRGETIIHLDPQLSSDDPNVQFPTLHANVYSHQVRNRLMPSYSRVGLMLGNNSNLLDAQRRHSDSGVLCSTDLLKAAAPMQRPRSRTITASGSSTTVATRRSSGASRRSSVSSLGQKFVRDRSTRQIPAASSPAPATTQPGGDRARRRTLAKSGSMLSVAIPKMDTASMRHLPQLAQVAPERTMTHVDSVAALGSKSPVSGTTPGHAASGKTVARMDSSKALAVASAASRARASSSAQHAAAAASSSSSLIQRPSTTERDGRGDASSLLAGSPRKVDATFLTELQPEETSSLYHRSQLAEYRRRVKLTDFSVLPDRTRRVMVYRNAFLETKMEMKDRTASMLLQRERDRSLALTSKHMLREVARVTMEDAEVIQRHLMPLREHSIWTSSRRRVIAKRDSEHVRSMFYRNLIGYINTQGGLRGAADERFVDGIRSMLVNQQAVDKDLLVAAVDLAGFEGVQDAVTWRILNWIRRDLALPISQLISILSVKGWPCPTSYLGTDQMDAVDSRMQRIGSRVSTMIA